MEWGGVHAAVPLNGLLQLATVHVTSYLWKSDEFRGNPSRLSVKTCAEIRGTYSASLRIVCSESADCILFTNIAVTTTILTPARILGNNHPRVVGLRNSLATLAT